MVGTSLCSPLVGVYWLDPVYKGFIPIFVDDGDGVTVIEILNAVVPSRKRSVFYINTLVFCTILVIDDYVTFGENVVE